MRILKAARIAVAIAATLLVGCADDETTSTDGGAAGMGGAGASGGAGGSGGAADGGGGSGGIGGSSALCGDGVLDPNEACDDGNATAGDGCDADCAIESGYTCPTPNAPCTLLDGNCAAPFPIVLTDVAGALRGGYDGDTTGADDDVAAASCDGQTIGTGGDAIHVFSLPDTLDVTVRSTFASGDGHIRVLTAPCDATQRAGGEPGFGDGCANGEAAAETEEITLLSMPPGDYYVVVDSQAGDEGAYALDVVAVTSTCENGTLEGVEECDDDNGINGDGCSQCVIDPHYTCSFTPSQCTNTCQDGVVDTAVLEQCDDGNATDGDRCSASCMLEHTVVEIEPNDSAVDAQPIADGDILLGSLQPFGDIDIYELVLTTDSFVLLETYETIDADPVNGSGGLGLLGDLPDCPAAGETDMYLFDDTSNVYDTGAALFADDLDGAGFCAFIGPNADATLLTAGTYYVRINDHAGGTMDHYVLDVTVRQPLGPGEMCSPQNDLCDPTQFLFCDGTTSLCTNNCGNGLVDAGEECDDGDADDNDRCNTSCILNADVVDNGNNDTFATGQPLASGEVARGSLDDSVDLFDVYTFTVATPSWVIMELYTTVDGDTGNYTGNGLDPELDCYDNLDLWLYDGTGDPSNTNTAWQFAFSDGDGNCDFFGPPSDGEWAYLPAGDYQVVVRESGIPNPVMLYALELQIVPALTTGDACNASFDLCHPFQNIDCDGTSTCFPRQTDRTSHQIFSNDFDLQNTTLTMRPTGGTYDVVATAALGYPDTPGTGSPTSNPPLFATDTVAVTTSFDFFGTTYTTVHVNSDGNITFDGGVPFAQQFTHFDVRRVSWFFDFLDPGAGGTVTLDRFVDRLTVTFHQVPRLSSVNVVEAQTQLFDDGTVTITHLNTTAGSAWVGISAGDALNTWPDEVDFSAHTLRAAASGDLIINEFLADPTGVDSNCDSTVDAAQDELVELVNVAGVPIDLNGVTLSDATQIRFTFGPLTLGAGRAVVVYGGGASQCANVNGVVAAGLDLDDTGDTITLSTGDSVTYGATTSGISRTRDPDVFGVFKDHDIAVGATANLSPGMRVIDWPF